MNIKQMSILMAITMALTACASGSYQWYKNGVSEFDTDNQISRCRYDIEMAKNVSPEQGKRMLANCMQKEGYRWVYR